MKLVFATNNSDKLKEVQKLMPKNIQLLSLKDIHCFDDIDETGKTLEENAKIKADYITNKYKLNCFADDTGLEVDALFGAPGVYSARFAGTKASYLDNVQKLLNELTQIKNRKARFKTVIALNLNGNQYLFEGICNGMITYKESGNYGFGYDSIFKPNGFNQTFAEMSLAQKSKISHRAKAMNYLIDFLTKTAG